MNCHPQLKPVTDDFKRLLTLHIKSNHILTTLETTILPHNCKIES